MENMRGMRGVNTIESKREECEDRDISQLSFYKEWFQSECLANELEQVLYISPRWTWGRLGYADIWPFLLLKICILFKLPLVCAPKFLPAHSRAYIPSHLCAQDHERGQDFWDNSWATYHNRSHPPLLTNLFTSRWYSLAVVNIQFARKALHIYYVFIERTDLHREWSSESYPPTQASISDRLEEWTISSHLQDSDMPFMCTPLLASSF